MTCHDIERLLYDRLTGRAAPEVCRTVEAHLQHCAHCQAASDAMQRTLLQLETWTVPEPSPDFQARLQARVAAHLETTLTRSAPPAEPVAAPTILTTRPQRNGLASLFRRQWFPLVGLALVATLAGIVVVYQGVGPGDHPPDQMTKGLQLEFAGTPIIIETSDPDRVLGDLRAIVQSHGGRLIREQPVTSGIEVTVNIAQRDEHTFLGDLRKLSGVSIPSAGYKDREGHLLVLLKKAGTFSPSRRPMGEHSKGDG